MIKNQMEKMITRLATASMCSWSLGVCGSSPHAGVGPPLRDDPSGGHVCQDTLEFTIQEPAAYVETAPTQPKSALGEDVFDFDAFVVFAVDPLLDVSGDLAHVGWDSIANRQQAQHAGALVIRLPLRVDAHRRPFAVGAGGDHQLKFLAGRCSGRAAVTRVAEPRRRHVRAQNEHPRAATSCGFGLVLDGAQGADAFDVDLIDDPARVRL